MCSLRERSAAYHPPRNYIGNLAEENKPVSSQLTHGRLGASKPRREVELLAR